MKSSTRRMRWFMITLFIVLMAACLGFSMFFMACKGGDSTENPPASSEENPDDGGEEKETTVESVVLSSSELSLTVGGSTDITVTVTMKEGYDVIDFSYAVDANGIITVTQSGDTLTVRADAAGTATITVNADGVSATCKVTVSAASSGEPTYEWVDTYADLETAMNLAGGSGNGHKVGSEGLTVGKFTFGYGAYFEDEDNGVKNYFDINTQSTSITFEVTGLYNNISFHGYRTTSGTAITYTLYSASDTTTAIYAWGPFEDDDADYYKSTGKYLDVGTYVLTPSSAARMYNIMVSEYVEESAPKEITATVATEDFLMGRNIAESDLGITVTLVYENGRKDTITSGYTTDITTAKLEAGANEITVTYSPNGDGQEFECSATIYLYETETIEISDFSMAYTGGTYYTNNVQKIYLTGDTVSYDYAAVTATASYDTGNNAAEVAFILTSSEVHFSTADESGNAVEGAFSDTGTYTVTATVDESLTTGSPVTASYDVNVVDATNADITAVRVIASVEEDEGNYADAEQATYAVGSDGMITVATINDAIQLIKLLGASDSVRKYIYVGAGQYWEKIYIDIPNLTLVGANSSETNELATRQDSKTGGTEIVYWAFNGLMDPSGTTTFSTVGSATVTVAKEAVGFCAANITFRNYWNTNALYNQCKEIDSNTQADAAYINADKVYFYNVTFTGYHDTLEAENGRQYYDHCYIEGRTDYIFGNTATCYFYYCNIHTIGAGDANNGGYVMAIKGTGIDYGYIFNYCNFTTDLETYYAGSDMDVDFKYTVEGTVSVARTWSGSDMHIAILNSSFDAGFSKEAYIASTGKGESGKNSRYTHMTAGQAPTPEYLVEYGNSGDGAISASIDSTCTVYTSESDIADYLDFTKIFAIQNGSVKYDDDWSGHSVEVVTVTVTANGNTYTVNGYKNSLTIADVIAAVKSEDATVEITVLYDESNNALDETTKVIADMTLTADTAEADMTVPSSVTYDFGYGAADVTITESGYYGYLDIQLGTGSFYYNGTGWFILSGDATISVKLSAGSVISVNMYATDALLVNGEDVSSSVEGTEGSCSYTYTAATDGETVTFSAASEKTLYIDGISVTVYVTYNIGDTISFVSATGVSITGSVGEYAGIIVDATSGKLTDNNGSCCQIGEGLVLKIYSTPNASAVVNFYQNDGTYAANYTVETDENGVITITITGPAETNSSGTSNMYITSIEIVDKTT